MTCSRSCEIFALLCVLHFSESLGTANNRQKDLNSGKSKISPQNEKKKRLSNTILYYAKKEDNRLRKLQRQINHYRRIFFVCVPLLFGHFKADFDSISASDDI